MSFTFIDVKQCKLSSVVDCFVYLVFSLVCIDIHVFIGSSVHGAAEG